MDESTWGSRVLRDFCFFKLVIDMRYLSSFSLVKTVKDFYHQKIHFRKKVSTNNNFILVVTLQLLHQLHSRTFSILSGYSRRDLCYREQKSTSGIHRTD